METIDRTAKERRAALSYLAHDARRIIASYQDCPRLRETLIRALCSRFSVGVIGAPRRSAQGYADEARDGVVVRESNTLKS